MTQAGNTDGQKNFVSFDGGVAARAISARPSELSLKGLSDMEEKALAGKVPRIARGTGLSYAAASFGQGCVSVDMTDYHRIIGYDQASGVVEVQAGATMGEVYNYLLDHGRYLVSQPGYPTITTGGCIAVDVHGKNQFRDGNFSDYVESIKLFHPAYGVIETSKRFNKEAFDLTMGAYGLTGHILSAKLQTKAIVGAQMDLFVEPIDNFADTPERIEKAARTCDSTVSWHDLSGEGKAFGRGFLINGKYKKNSGAAEKLTKLPPGHFVDSYNRAGLGLSFYSLPLTRLINVLYGGLSTMRTEPRTVPIHDCFYPSRRLRDLYFKMFGTAGFHESQLLVPVECFDEFTAALRHWLSINELPVTLASAKFFNGKQHSLKFCGKGVCFAVNFPRSEVGQRFLVFLDDLCLKLKLLPYIAKDSRLPLAVVKGCYPEYETFRQRLQKYDPERLFCSELSRRLQL